MDLIFQLLIFVPIGFFFGRSAERKHLKSLEEREKAVAGFSVSDLKSFPGISTDTPTPKLFTGEVTIASDYYKRFAGGIRNFFGGEMKSFQSLAVRARREALLRIIEQAKLEGYNAICNLRMDSADIGGSADSRKGSVMVTIIASATAFRKNEGQ
ncbi:MAG TPA: heavy metal-binding domain-containing protein [Victivallales bacterium]|nr:heavy metal-binding domain-containing protein [Victivallales bacterium]